MQKGFLIAGILHVYVPGKPTILNVKGATKLLKDGDYIVMDAGKGKITTPIRRT